MSRVLPARVHTKPGFVARVMRALRLRHLNSQLRQREQTEAALVAGIEADELQLRRLNRLGQKNLILASRREFELHELAKHRAGMEALRAEIARVECAQ